MKKRCYFRRHRRTQDADDLSCKNEKKIPILDQGIVSIFIFHPPRAYEKVSFPAMDKLASYK